MTEQTKKTRKRSGYFLEVINGKPVFRVTKSRTDREVMSDKEHLVLFQKLYLSDYMNLISLCLALMGSYKARPPVTLDEELIKDLQERRRHARQDLTLLNERFKDYADIT